MPGLLLREPRTDRVVHQGIQWLGICDGTHRFRTEEKRYYRFLATPAARAKNRRGMPLLTVRNRDDLKLGFELHQLFYCQSDLVFAAELGAQHLLAGMFDVIRVSLGRQAHVLYLAHQCFRALPVELAELFHFRALPRA